MPSIPRPASTVVLARPAGSTFEVFLVRRHDNIAFMGGAHVFPGGRVDEADLIDDADARCDGVSAAVARMPDVGPEQGVAFHVAAIRELFEEAGVLLARHSGSIVAIEDADARWRAHRLDLLEQRVTMPALAERESLRLALDEIALFAHWVTPDVETRRFDTYFFFAVAPAAQQAAHDERETTHGAWLQPADALERCLAGEIALPPPTWTTLRWLSAFSSVGEAWRWAHALPIPRVQPCVGEGDNGARIIMLPGDPSCPPVEGFTASETRFVLADGRWRPIAAG